MKKINRKFLFQFILLLPSIFFFQEGMEENQSEERKTNNKKEMKKEIKQCLQRKIYFKMEINEEGKCVLTKNK